MIPLSQQACRSCHYFKRTGMSGSAKVGQCRYAPPVLFAVQMHNPGHTLDPRQPSVVQGFQGVFPPTEEGNWCGKWCLKTEGEA